MLRASKAKIIVSSYYACRSDVVRRTNDGFLEAFGTLLLEAMDRNAGNTTLRMPPHDLQTQRALALELSMFEFYKQILRLMDSEDLVRRAYAHRVGKDVGSVDINAARLSALHHICAAVLATLAPQGSFSVPVLEWLLKFSASPLVPWHCLIPRIEDKLESMRALTS
eukprot:Blabericola_migrator_1__4092@NODE_2247_length_3061_cov_15_831663_g1415_i0_p2_GENE_NODE_2247_length_3061_cov_15_831663_g1415_i0NODE_2247_length_3061_cov_15_831663_g1415_i0_p2_ORF_typecomplete_len167_score18_32Bcl2/PF00452_19/0_27_NODE_2247_length_3061_cov_15_831663_g1415_i022832783